MEVLADFGILIAVMVCLVAFFAVLAFVLQRVAD
jgi:hypothetical protein